MPIEWTLELTQRVRRLAERDGKTAAEIAKKLGTTKNAIVSLAHRVRPKIQLGNGHASTNARQGRVAKPKEAKKPRKAKAPPRIKPGPLPTAPKPKFFILEEIEGEVHFEVLRKGDRRCRFPRWPDRMGTSIRPKTTELYYCGKRTPAGSHWCEECRKKVYMTSVIEKVEPGQGRKVDAVGRPVGWQYGT